MCQKNKTIWFIRAIVPHYYCDYSLSHSSSLPLFLAFDYSFERVVFFGQSFKMIDDIFTPNLWALWYCGEWKRQRSTRKKMSVHGAVLLRQRDCCSNVCVFCCCWTPRIFIVLKCLIQSLEMFSIVDVRQVWKRSHLKISFRKDWCWWFGGVISDGGGGGSFSATIEWESKKRREKIMNEQRPTSNFEVILLVYDEQCGFSFFISSPSIFDMLFRFFFSLG